ncbi:hypothetical protein B5E87_00205 [Massilimicrobiota sp. An142]|uniref:hypothetical protein n=1 Tax=Massilimicrobiota sp. An142 TaxID=1965564 RepID=UPI000B38E716|nr:hypothetical protein [Massilimicrobiota sp. An142]OUQ15028.1 hypothetical protein B5E87_00205 [Massilimicrobiota sp. An142]
MDKDIDVNSNEEEKKDVDSTTAESEESKESFTKEELLDYVKNELKKQKEAEEEAKRKAEEDSKLSEKEKEDRDLKNAQIKLKVDRFNFDIEKYKASLNLLEDETLSKLLKTDAFINSENAVEDAKDFINNYKTAIDGAYNKGKADAEADFNKIKMGGQDIFDGFSQKKQNPKITDFDSFFDSLEKNN